MHMFSMNQAAGFPARVTITGTAAGTAVPPLRLHGMVAQVTQDSVVIDLFSPGPGAINSDGISIEILHSEGLIQFDAELLRASADPMRIRLALPQQEELRWVQRRKKVRAGLHTACLLWPANQARPARPWNGITQNVSAGGMAVEVQASLAVGDRVMVELPALRDTAETELLTEVVRENSQADGHQVVALRFLAMSLTQEALLNRLVESALNQAVQAHVAATKAVDQPR